MGENQGMIWIILGVLAVAAGVIAMAGYMSSSMDSAGSAVSNATQDAINGVSTSTKS